MRITKYKWQKCLIALILLLSSLILGISNHQAMAATVSDYNTNQVNLDVKAAIAIDAKNGQVLYAKNASQKMPIASMSKLITIYLTLQAIKNNKLSWNQKVKPTKQIVKVSQNPDYSGVPLYSGHSYTIKQLYQSTLIQSANGSAMLLAQSVAGSQQKFVSQMRALVKNWGIKGAKLYTPDGLPNYTQGKDAYTNVSKNSENELSASDMAVIVDKLLTDFPEVTKTTKIAHMNFNDHGKITKMDNWNWMLKGLSQYDPNYPLDGLKTGTTDAAGACFTGTMVKNGRRIITVVMGAKHKDGTDPSRFTQTKKLLNYVFSNYQLYIMKKNQAIDGAKTVSVPDGKSETANLVMQKDTGIWIQNGKSISAKFSEKQLAAPIKAGQKIGNFEIRSIPSIKSDKGVELPATVKNDVAKANIFVRIWRAIFH
ncbi:D-alanyl-D-alanine carboxypeptidase (penicillin-binding protein 5/6) [Lactobacillus colini]|uniref:serine-type D-Ala-D-Ala carboxypeptidase n=1 Tax=Lactobacillus colini TaxID=1819254 RepID=A0ABS4MF24_9LACO|nr:D-alanyl-D-alanine carboxypeptidase family protein [Lactobacillus colini]MBP2058271.1 D-alanyl-D-alanine carboxypeptidase (penicillin-binding protein 5/6) [Lactobacillus colini]